MGIYLEMHRQLSHIVVWLFSFVSTGHKHIQVTDVPLRQVEFMLHPEGGAECKVADGPSRKTRAGGRAALVSMFQARGSELWVCLIFSSRDGGCQACMINGGRSLLVHQASTGGERAQRAQAFWRTGSRMDIGVLVCGTVCCRRPGHHISGWLKGS